MNTTAIENHQLKGITVKNVVVTIFSTGSIVASVITTYFGLKTDIQVIKSAQETEAKINNLRISVLEVSLLQKEVDEIRGPAKMPDAAAKNSLVIKSSDRFILSAVQKR
jgi:hypothetical protein